MPGLGFETPYRNTHLSPPHPPTIRSTLTTSTPRRGACPGRCGGLQGAGQLACVLAHGLAPASPLTHPRSPSAAIPSPSCCQFTNGTVHVKASYDKAYELVLMPLQAAVLVPFNDSEHERRRCCFAGCGRGFQGQLLPGGCWLVLQACTAALGGSCPPLHRCHAPGAALHCPQTRPGLPTHPQPTP